MNHKEQSSLFDDIHAYKSVRDVVMKADATDLVIKFKGKVKVIKCNQDGLYRLNDLHEAAGGLDKDQPAHFKVYAKSRPCKGRDYQVQSSIH